MKTLISIVVALTLFISANASTTTATSSGDWDESIWDNGEPGCFDTIVIPAGVTVTIATTVDLTACPDSIIILISGELAFVNGRKLKLPCESDVYVGNGGSITPGSGGGNSNYIETCGTTYWNAGSGPVTGPATLCDGGCVTLPIELISFVAIRNVDERKVDLLWQTMSESDNDYFTIERSGDIKNWQVVTQVKGAGNSVSVLNYSESDYNPENGVNYYRLKQTDFNGDFAYSPIVSVIQNNSESLLVYPNPVSLNEQLIVSFPSHYQGVQQIKMCDLTGKTVLELQRDVTNVHQLVVTLPSDMAGGSYCLFAGEEKSIVIVK